VVWDQLVPLWLFGETARWHYINNVLHKSVYQIYKIALVRRRPVYYLTPELLIPDTGTFKSRSIYILGDCAVPCSR